MGDVQLFFGRVQVVMAQRPARPNEIGYEASYNGWQKSKCTTFPVMIFTELIWHIWGVLRATLVVYKLNYLLGGDCFRGAACGRSIRDALRGVHVLGGPG